jgi:hypothetical protein
MKSLVLLLLLIASTACADIYTWKDAKGTSFYTNSLDEIPARYRSRAKLLDVASGKKFPLDKAPPSRPATAGSGQSAAAPTPPVAPPAPAVAPPSLPASPVQAPPAGVAAPGAADSQSAPPQPGQGRRRRHTNPTGN